MAKIFLHIGPHKTGSTYIQKNLFLNQAALAASGIFYPPIGNVPTYGHHVCAAQMQRRGRSSELEAVLTQVNNYTSAKISSENFDRLNEEQISKLANRLLNYEVEVLYFLRRPDDLLFSHWKESIKHGNAATWAEFVADHTLNPKYSKILNPCIVLDPYNKAFEGRLRVFDFDEYVYESKDLFVGMMEYCSPDAKLLPVTGKANISKGVAHSEILRALNAAFNSRQGFSLGMKLLRALDRTPKEIRSPLISKMVQIINSNLRSVDIKIDGTFDFFWERARKKYALNFIGARIESLKSRSYSVPSSNWIYNGEAAEAFEQLYSQVVEKVAMNEQEMRAVLPVKKNINKQGKVLES